MNFLVSPGKIQFHFLENKIFFLWLQNARWFFSKHTWKHDIFCIFGKDGHCVKSVQIQSFF